jgi:bifunctional DNA-binding transcriptional regulator/antitoxin component of YhaV-PrlF toxin-antitoxin module
MWTRTIIEDPNQQGEYILDLGDEICEAVGWKPGDTLVWIDNKDGTWTLRKKTTMLMRYWQNFANRLKTLTSRNNQ